MRYRWQRARARAKNSIAPPARRYRRLALQVDNSWRLLVRRAASRGNASSSGCRSARKGVNGARNAASTAGLIRRDAVVTQSDSQAPKPCLAAARRGADMNEFDIVAGPVEDPHRSRGARWRWSAELGLANSAADPDRDDSAAHGRLHAGTSPMAHHLLRPFRTASCGCHRDRRGQDRSSPPFAPSCQVGIPVV